MKLCIYKSYIYINIYIYIHIHIYIYVYNIYIYVYDLYIHNFIIFSVELRLTIIIKLKRKEGRRRSCMFKGCLLVRNESLSQLFY